MEQKELQIDIAALAKQAIQDRQPGEDLDEALLRVCKRTYGDAGLTAFEAIRNALGALAEQSKVDVETALRQMAEGGTSFRMQTIVRQTASAQNITAGSLSDLPPDVRAEVEKAMASGKSAQVVITRKVTTAKEGWSPTLGVTEQEGLYRCPSCGYQSQTDWTFCPQCGKERKRSFWSRLFGK